MRVMSKLLALALTAALQPAFAATVPLAFEDITAADGQGTGFVQLGDRYKNDKHIQFIGSAWGTTSFECDSLGGFVDYNGGCAALLLAGDPTDRVLSSTPVSFTLNFTDGFVKGSSFVYAALARSGLTITLFDALDGKGTGTAVTDLTTQTCGLDDVSFCIWSQVKLDFAGTAYSMVVSGRDEGVMLDGLSLIQAAGTPPNPLPEPASLALALGALGAVGWTRKRAAR